MLTAFATIAVVTLLTLFGVNVLLSAESRVQDPTVRGWAQWAFVGFYVVVLTGLSATLIYLA